MPRITNFLAQKVWKSTGNETLIRIYFGKYKYFV